MAGAGEPGFDPSVLDAAQRHGDACVVCRKRWPRPRVRVGHVPGGGGVFACAECAALLPVPPPAPRADDAALDGDRSARHRPACATTGD